MIPHGWTDLGGQARKFHFIPEDDDRALCGKWGINPFFTNARERLRFQEDTGKDSPDDCKACARKMKEKRVLTDELSGARL